MQHHRATLLPLLLGLAAGQAVAQNVNILHPVDVIERRLGEDPLNVIDWRGSRAEGDRTQRVALSYDDGSTMVVKWAKAWPGASDFNNEPRYEVAAYELQKMYLDPADYVVPPTVLRSVPLTWLQGYDDTAQPTFDEAGSVLVVLQYWLFDVSNENFWDESRFDRDSIYARHFADMNLLTHLINHVDENVGNFLISMDSLNPHVYSVDNGVAFRSDRSDRGYRWRELRVNRLPHATIERLRAITREELGRRLGVLATYRVADGLLVPVESETNLNPGRGVRRMNGMVQLGLTNREVDDVWKRLRELLERVDAGRVALF